MNKRAKTFSSPVDKCLVVWKDVTAHTAAAAETLIKGRAYVVGLSVLIRRPAAAITATLGTCNVTSNNCVAENNTSQTCTALTYCACTVGLHAYYYYPVGECDCHLRLSANSSRERVLLSINSKTNKITTENVIVNLNCFFYKVPEHRE